MPSCVKYRAVKQIVHLFVVNKRKLVANILVLPNER
jgi:hypothetical protein